MRLSAVVLGLFLMPLAAGAQPCEERAAAQPGGWIQGDDTGGSGSPVTARHREQIRSILDELAALVRAAYPEPAGSQGKITGNWGLEPVSEGLAAYELVANFKGYGCDRRTNPDGVVYLYGETATWLYIQINGIWPGPTTFEYPQHFLAPDNPEGLVTLRPARVLRTPRDPGRKAIDATLPASILAFPNLTFEGEYDSTDYSYNRREVSQVVFVTPDGRPPYDPLTIGEFLDLNEARLKAYIAENAQYGGVDYHQELLAGLPALRQRLASRLGETAHLKSFSWSESELAAAAPFADAATGYMVARRSARYAAGAGDPYRPRFITVIWRWQPEAPYSVRVHQALRDGLDFTRLQAMLEIR